MLRLVAETFARQCKEAGLPALELPDRARQLSTIINALVPEWVVESRAVAAAAGVPVATFMAYSSMPDLLHAELQGPAGEGGTAYAAAGKACHGARAILHLSRDGRRVPQFALSRAASPGTLAYVALSGGADIGIHAFVNEGGLAGCWQPGPAVRDPGGGLRPPLMLRALAERCLTCPQAAALFSDLQSRYGLYTPGERGVTFLFADAAGEVLQLEARSLKAALGSQREGLVICANQFQLPDSPGGPQAREVHRQRKLSEYLLAMPLDPYRAMAGARLHSGPNELGVCNDRSVAGFTAVLGAPCGTPWAAVSIGSPRCVQPVALFPSHGVPAPLVDGSAWNAAEALRARLGSSGLADEKRAGVDRKLAEILAPLSDKPLDAAFRESIIAASFAYLLDFMDDANEPA